MAAEAFAYLCAVTLIGLFVWACLVTVSYAYGQSLPRLDLAYRQFRMFRRIRRDGKGWRQAWADAQLIRHHTVLILDQMRHDNDGLTAEQIQFRDEVEHTIWRIPTVEEAA